MAGEQNFFHARMRTPLVMQSFSLLLFIAVWEIIGRTGLLFPDLFPSIFEILQSLWIYISTPLMLPHIQASLYEIGGALVLASVLGIPLGILWAAGVLGSRSSNR